MHNDKYILSFFLLKYVIGHPSINVILKKGIERPSDVTRAQKISEFIKVYSGRLKLFKKQFLIYSSHQQTRVQFDKLFKHLIFRQAELNLEKQKHLFCLEFLSRYYLLTISRWSKMLFIKWRTLSNRGFPFFSIEYFLHCPDKTCCYNQSTDCQRNIGRS